MADNPEHARFVVDLNNLQEAKKIIKAVQREARAALQALAVLEQMSSDDKEADDVVKWPGT